MKQQPITLPQAASGLAVSGSGEGTACVASMGRELLVAQMSSPTGLPGF